MTNSSQPMPRLARTAGQPRRRHSRWQAAGEVLRSHLRPLPEPSAGPPPRLGQRGRVVTSGLAALFLLVMCGIVWVGGHSASSTPTPVATPTPGRTAASPAGTDVALVSASQQAAAFLAAYFSWDARDTDATYAARWQPYVAPAALTELITGEPLLTLDHGRDVAARSPVPTIPSETLAEEGRQIHLGVVWTLQVLPEGGEGATWQPRQVRAALVLAQTATTWQVSALTWSE